jgi:hypothetical protein
MGEHHQAPEIARTESIELSGVDPNLLSPLDQPFVDLLAEGWVVAYRPGQKSSGTDVSVGDRPAATRAAEVPSPVGPSGRWGLAPLLVAVALPVTNDGNRAADVPRPVGPVRRRYAVDASGCFTGT